MLNRAPLLQRFSEACLDFLPVKAENARLDQLDIDKKSKKETDGFRTGTRLVRKDERVMGRGHVIGIVVQVVSKSDDANEYEYAYVWVVWEDGTFTAPGDNKSQLHAMRKNYKQLKGKIKGKLDREPDITRSLFVDKWCARPPRRRPHTPTRYLERRGPSGASLPRATRGTAVHP